MHMALEIGKSGYFLRKVILYMEGHILEVIDMVLANETAVEDMEQELELFVELDKGIDDMEAGRVTPHDEAMKKIRESVGLYEV